MGNEIFFVLQPIVFLKTWVLMKARKYFISGPAFGMIITLQRIKNIMIITLQRARFFIDLIVSLCSFLRKWMKMGDCDDELTAAQP